MIRSGAAAGAAGAIVAFNALGRPIDGTAAAIIIASFIIVALILWVLSR